MHLNPFNHPHQASTANPQTYWEHGVFAFKNSCRIFVAGIFGMIHAFLPGLFPFYTSSAVIKSFKKLVDSQRHHDELKRFLTLETIEDVKKTLSE